MLEAIVAGQTDSRALAQMARGRLRDKIPELEKALTGRIQPHHRFLLAKQLAHVDFLDEQVADIGAEIGCQLEQMSQLPEQPPAKGGNSSSDVGELAEGELPARPLTWNQAVVLLDTVPGIDRQAAEAVLAETGLDMRQFPTDKDLAAWAGLAPGNNQSGGKRYSGRTRKGNSSLKTCLVRIAWAAVRTKDTFLKARYQRLASRRGKRRAIVAVAHSILVSIWHMLSDGTPYVELGGDYFDQRKKEVKVSYLTRQLEKLTGGTVQIELVPVAA